eukprot:g3727.t1 g3727   contig13:15864-17481(+)
MGAVYFYKLNSTSNTWGDEQKIVASDGTHSHKFGDVVAMSGTGHLVVAVSGAVYLYTLNSTSNTWDFEQKIVASDGAEYDNFGYAVAISETGHLLVGARYDDDMGSASGSVYAIGEGMAFDAEGGDTSESETFCTTTTTTTTTAATTTTSTISTTTTTTSTPEPKFWPDWLGDDTCVFNEKFPQYMQLNPSWTGSTLEDCCKRYYSWRYDDCMVEGGGTSNTATLYYPNWEGSDHVCVNDGEAPDYITQAASTFMFEDLEDCCEKYYWWNMAECLGSVANAGSHKYYADYRLNKCVKDCTDSDCGGLVGGVWDELYNDKSVCCAEKFWWVEDCDA